MKKYRIGDVLIRDDGGIRVIVSEKEKIFFLASICYDSRVISLPHFKNMVMSDHYEKVEV